MNTINIDELEEKVEKRLENMTNIEKASAEYHFNSKDTSRFVFDVYVQARKIWINPYNKLGKINSIYTSKTEKWDYDLSFQVDYDELDGEQ